MWNMSLHDLIISIIVAAVVIGIFTIVVFVIAKKSGQKLEELLADIPEECGAEGQKPRSGCDDA